MGPSPFFITGCTPGLHTVDLVHAPRLYPELQSLRSPHRHKRVAEASSSSGRRRWRRCRCSQSGSSRRRRRRRRWQRARRRGLCRPSSPRGEAGRPLGGRPRRPRQRAAACKRQVNPLPDVVHIVHIVEHGHPAHLLPALLVGSVGLEFADQLRWRKGRIRRRVGVYFRTCWSSFGEFHVRAAPVPLVVTVANRAKMELHDRVVVSFVRFLESWPLQD